MLDIFYQIYNITISTFIKELEMKIKGIIITVIAFYAYLALWLYYLLPTFSKYFGA
jgi:hypothetical protein